MLFDQYGEDLVCVRRRYDAERETGLKSAGIIFERAPWKRSSKRLPAEKIVCIRIEYCEVESGRKMKAAGGKWNREQKVWEITYAGEAIMSATVIAADA